MAAPLHRSLTSTLEADEHAEGLGFRRRQIPPDGNCLYRAAAEVCLGSQRDHSTVRLAVAAFVRANRDRFEPFIDDSDFDEYVDKIARDGHWGSDLELQAIAEIYKVSFSVHRHRAPAVSIEPTQGEPARVAALWFSHGNHYDVLYTPEEFRERGLHADNNDELDAYRQKVREEEEASINLSRELSSERPAGGPVTEETVQELLAAGLTVEELAGQFEDGSSAPEATSVGARPAARRQLSEEQRRRPTIANLLDAGFSEAEIAAQFAQLETAVTPGAGTGLPAEVRRRPTVMSLLQAGVSEEEIRRQILDLGGS
mmetsp:Transcript_11455/g.29786  ORF Transcript_11455/g.29786 Transcript_11455/m.29786 type:complete len:314 (+) Transcript_11455:7-948(+)